MFRTVRVATGKFRRALGSASAPGPIARYNDWLSRFPLVTKGITSGLIVAFGDTACQLAVEKKDTFDWARMLRMGLLGTVLVAPALHGWYVAVDSRARTWVTMADTAGQVATRVSAPFLNIGTASCTVSSQVRPRRVP